MCLLESIQLTFVKCEAIHISIYYRNYISTSIERHNWKWPPTMGENWKGNITLTSFFLVFHNLSNIKSLLSSACIAISWSRNQNKGTEPVYLSLPWPFHIHGTAVAMCQEQCQAMFRFSWQHTYSSFSFTDTEFFAVILFCILFYLSNHILQLY